MSDVTLIPLDRSTTPERIAASLREKIARRELKPGTRLHEVRFTKAYGVSRHTLREAISLLVGEGLLSRTSYKGVEVTQLTPADVRDIYAARRGIELPAVDALAVGSVDRHSALFEAIDRIAALPGSVDSRTVHLADSAIHLALVAAHGSKRLLSSFASLMTELHILLFEAYSPDDLMVTAANHRAFGELIRQGEFGQARAQLDARLRGSEEEMVKLCLR